MRGECIGAIFLAFAYGVEKSRVCSILVMPLGFLIYLVGDLIKYNV